jgi:sterol desaturase/sphingolipid hydroxylase (fatty acid hydroxylase superfamily)
MEWLSMLDAPEERLHWPYLVSALLIALLGAAAGRVNLRTELFTRALWWHPSARADYGLLALRAIISLLLLVPLLVSSTVVAVKVASLLSQALGAPPAWPLGTLGTTVSYTALLFVTSDAARYLLHRALHEVPWLWRFHQVHHSAEVMTPFTLYRTHPVEGLLVAVRAVMITGLVGGAFSWLTGGQAIASEVVGVNAAAFALNLAGSNLRHSHLWISFGPLEWLLMSPAQHQLHHSRETSGHRVNYGAFLALWDVLGRTLVRAKTRPVAFGVERQHLNHDPWNVFSLLGGPFRRRR